MLQICLSLLKVFFFHLTSRKNFNDAERCIVVEYLPLKERPAQTNQAPGKIQSINKLIVIVNTVI